MPNKQTNYFNLNTGLNSDNIFKYKEVEGSFKQIEKETLNTPLVLICTKGSALLHIDNKSYPISNYSFHIMLPRMSIRFSNETSDFKLKYILFSLQYLQTITLRIKINFFYFLSNVSPLNFSQNPILWDKAVRFMNECEYIYNIPNHLYYKMMVQNLVQSMFFDMAHYAQLNKKIEMTTARVSNTQNTLIEKFFLLIKKHFQTHRNVSFYADKLCISSRYLSSLTQNEVKKSPKTIINEFLTLEIKDMLMETNIPIQQIAENFHFSDQSAFGRYFKNQTGVSPMEFRKNK